MFAHVKMRALVQSQRFNVYTVIDSLVASHREGLCVPILTCPV